MKLVRVVAKHFVAGFECNDEGRVILAAPILKYLVGHSEEFARDYFSRKGWKASIVTQQEGDHGHS